MSLFVVVALLQESLRLTPPSLGGWIALFLSVGSFLLLVSDRITGRGKSVARMDAKVDQLGEDVEDMQSTLKVIDSHLTTLSDNVRMLTYEVKGVDGQNGIKGTVRHITDDIKRIDKRNAEMDQLAAVVRHDLEWRGVEKREAIRRLKDRLELDAADIDTPS